MPNKQVCLYLQGIWALIRRRHPHSRMPLGFCHAWQERLRESVQMIFGGGVRRAEAVVATEWLERSCRGEPGTAGGLVPNQYASLLRVHPPAPYAGDWWSSYRSLFDVVASVGESHTSSPDRAWFAIWEGHGFGSRSRGRAWRDPPADEAERRARDADQARLRDEDRCHNAAIAEGLAAIPRFDRPHRTYYLLEGPVTAVTGLRHPDGDGWRNPDLFWPDDQSWFVATDVDFWSLYIGGSLGFITELAGSLPTRSAPVELDFQLETED